MKNDVKSFCYYSYVGPFWLIGLFSDVKKDETLRFHMNQGAVLFIFELCAILVALLLDRLFAGKVFEDNTLLGWLVTSSIGLLACIAAVGMAMLGMFNVTRGRESELPLIGRIRVIK